MVEVLELVLMMVVSAAEELEVLVELVAVSRRDRRGIRRTLRRFNFNVHTGTSVTVVMIRSRVPGLIRVYVRPNLPKLDEVK